MEGQRDSPNGLDTHSLHTAGMDSIPDQMVLQALMGTEQSLSRAESSQQKGKEMKLRTDSKFYLLRKNSKDATKLPYR